MVELLAVVIRSVVCDFLVFLDIGKREEPNCYEVHEVCETPVVKNVFSDSHSSCGFSGLVRR